MRQNPGNSRRQSFLWPYHAGKYFERIKGNRNAGAITEENVRVRNGMFFTAVDTNLPIALSVHGSHGEIIV